MGLKKLTMRWSKLQLLLCSVVNLCLNTMQFILCRIEKKEFYQVADIQEKCAFQKSQGIRLHIGWAINVTKLLIAC